MSKYKILFKITGSIAAYKSAYLISKLVQNNCEVKCVVTNSALKFIGNATLEGLTGNRVFLDGFEHGEMMSHISLVKWADLTIIAPASANTINKFSAGIADNLVASLFLAHDFSKPYLIAPAMNTAMYMHASTQESLKKLERWGIIILPTDEGYLACGDTGKGKLLEPDKIFEIIMQELRQTTNVKENLDKKIVITSGGTRESIDGIRFISNMSTGKTGAAIAEHFVSRGWDVTYLHSTNAALPKYECRKISFDDFKSLETNLFDFVSQNTVDAVIHLAAVSDFKVISVSYEGEVYQAPLIGKIPSTAANLKIDLTTTNKIVDGIKQNSKNKLLLLTAFKFTSNDSVKVESEVNKLLEHSKADFVVLNHPEGRDSGEQKYFRLFNFTGFISQYITVNDLAVGIEQIFNSELNKRGNNAALS
ncbi:MAG: bifunctional phosphopantothenoylcysteine decarboxylase/phosphopantothenate--cysteine ligase CoaBC [bacterium]